MLDYCNMKKITIILLFVLSLVNNIIVYSLTEVNTKDKIDLVLEENLDTLKIHYKILLENQRITAITVHLSTIQMKRVIEIMREANGASEDEKNVLRKEF